jgi:hypothetical protein
MVELCSSSGRNAGQLDGSRDYLVLRKGRNDRLATTANVHD